MHMTAQYAVEQAAKENQSNETNFDTGLLGKGEPPPADGGSFPQSADAPLGDAPEDSQLHPTDEEVVSVEDRIAQARAEGFEEGRRQAGVELEQLSRDAEHFSQGLEQLHELHRNTVQAAAKDIGTLVSSLTRRLFYDNLVLHPTALSALIEEALNAMPEDQKVWITVHPDHIDRMGNLTTTGREIEIIEDEKVEAGFRIHNKYASIDATLSKLIEGIDAAVQKWQSNE